MILVSISLIGCATRPVLTIDPDAPPAVQMLSKRPLNVVGGGVARGFAHIGVIQVLEETGIRPSLVVGTSAGSLVAAFYASGKTGAQLQQVAETMEEAA